MYGSCLYGWLSTSVERLCRSLQASVVLWALSKLEAHFLEKSAKMSGEDPEQYLRPTDKATMLERTKTFDAKKWLWIPDEKEGYLAASVASTKGDMLTVETSAGKVPKFYYCKLIQRSKASLYPEEHAIAFQQVCDNFTQTTDQYTDICLSVLQYVNMYLCPHCVRLSMEIKPCSLHLARNTRRIGLFISQHNPANLW